MTDRPRNAPPPAPRRRIATFLTAGLLAVALAGLVAPEVEPVHGQTGPRRPTPPIGQPTPLATLPAGVPTVAATVVVAPPSSGPIGSGGTAPVPLSPLGGAPGAPAAAVPPTAAPAAPTTAPAAPLLAAGAAPGAQPASAASSPQPAAPLVLDDSPGAPPVVVPTPFIAPPQPASSGGPLVSAIVPAAAEPNAAGLAVVSSADSAPVRVTIFAPPRADGPVRLNVGAPDPAAVAGISLPGAVIARAFTVDASRTDGALVSTHPRPLTLVVGYTDADVAFAGGDPRRLHVVRWDPDRRVGIVLDTVVDPAARTLSAQTDHTSLFLIAGLEPSAPREISARIRAPWGTEPAPAGPIPSAMPRVGNAGADRGLSDWLPAIVGTALAVVAAAATPRPRAAARPPRRWPRRRVLLLVTLVCALLALLDPTVRLIAGTLVRLPQLAITLGGFGAPRTFLVISQSTDEPRPTGGFLGSMGALTTHGGRVESFEYRNSLEFEDSRAPTVRPPAPLERYAGLGGWILRDANWSPDFPSTMEQIDWFWQRDQGTRLDGALAIDEEGLVQLLAATGPVVVPETGEEVGSEDVRRWIIFQLYPIGRDGRPFVEGGSKTRVLSALGQAVLKRILSPSPRDVGPYASALARVVREKHLLLWFRDPTLQGLVASWGADGAIRSAPGDYLAVVDTSVTLNKMGRYVASRVDYAVEPRPEQGVLRARTTVTYENRYDAVEARRYYPPSYLSRLYNPRADRFDDVEGLWATWLRVYAPSGAVLRGASGLDEPVAVDTELGKTVFGSYVTIGVGERRRLTFEYDLPYRDTSDGYSLLLQRQPGVLRSYAVTLERAGRKSVLFDGTLAADRELSARPGA